MSTTKTKSKRRKPAPQLELWLRIGDCGEYENYGQDFSALADAIHEHRITSDNISWHLCPRNPAAYARKHGLPYLPSAGFVTGLGTGVSVWTDVSLFWGDETGESIIQPLTQTEQRDLVRRIRNLENETGPADEGT